MPAVIAAAIIVGILCLLGLLIFGVIRRPRGHADLPRGRRLPVGPPVIGLRTGQSPEPFAVVTVDGIVATASAGLRLAAFFSATCPASPGQVAPFTDYVRANQFDSDSVLVTVLAARDAPLPAYLSQFTGVALVTIEPDGNPVAKAFGVAGYPAFCLLDTDGTVVSSGSDPAGLPIPAMA
jgi:hypothetical protein